MDDGKVWPGYNPGWGCGGIKFSSTNGAILKNNYVHNNGGRGLWSDVSTINSVYANNVCINNAADGIAHEISFDAVIKDNIVCFNGDVPTNGWLWGAGINIQNSGGYRTNESYSDGTKAKAAADSGWIDVHDNIVVVAGRGNGMSTLFQNRGEDHTGQGYGSV